MVANHSAGCDVSHPLIEQTISQINFFFFYTQGYTPLHLAAIHGRDDVIKMLVTEYGESCFFSFDTK